MFAFVLDLFLFCLSFGMANGICFVVMFPNQVLKCFHLFWQRTSCFLVELAFLCSGMPEASQPHFVPCNNNLA